MTLLYLRPRITSPPIPDLFAGGTYYVDPANATGAALDSHSTGEALSASLPWRTLATAAATAPADSLVYVLSGSATSTTLTTARDAWVTFRPAPAPAAAVTLAGLRITNGAAFMAFEDFTGAAGITSIFNVTNGATTSSGTSTCHHIAARRNAHTVPTGFASSCVSIRFGSSNIWVEDCDIAGDPIPATGSQVVFNIGASATSSTSPLVSHIFVRRNAVHIARQGDMVKINRPEDVWIEDNELYDSARVDGSSHCDMIQTLLNGGDGLHILRNYIHNEMTVTTQLQGLFLTAMNMTGVEVVGNLLHDLGPGTDVELSQEQNMVFANNTVIGNMILAAGTAPLLTVKSFFNNVITSGLQVDAGVTIAAEDYNLVGGTKTGITLGAHSTTTAPTFQDAVAHDYRLAVGSAGRGAGVASLNGVSAPTTYREGAAFALDMGSEGSA